MSLIVSSGGLSRTVNGYISLGNAKLLITVTFPINVNLRCCHCFKQTIMILVFIFKSKQTFLNIWTNIHITKL